MKSNKIFSIFAMRRLRISVVKSTNKFFTYHKGVVPNSFCSNAESDLRKSKGLHPLFTIYKLFSNAKIRKQFIKSSTRYCVRYGYFTKRSTTHSLGIFKNARLQMVQGANQTTPHFNFFQGFKKQFSLWFGFRHDRSVTLANGQSLPVYCLVT